MGNVIYGEAVPGEPEEIFDATKLHTEGDELSRLARRKLKKAILKTVQKKLCFFC